MNEEFACIRKVARDFPYVSMDTEFPGVVAKPTGTFRNNSDYQYAMLHFCLPTGHLARTIAQHRGLLDAQVPVSEDER